VCVLMCLSRYSFLRNPLRGSLVLLQMIRDYILEMDGSLVMLQMIGDYILGMDGSLVMARMIGDCILEMGGVIMCCIKGCFALNTFLHILHL
jgi:hypothetical protein